MTEAETKSKRPYRMSVRAERSEATAARIRDEALKQFLTRSYDEVTLAGVAEAAAVTVPTLVAHFGRKEELFVAACRDRFDQITGSRDEAPAGELTAAVRNLFDSYEADGDGVLHLLAEEDRFPAVREMTDAGRRYHRDGSSGSSRRASTSLYGAARRAAPGPADRRHRPLRLEADASRDEALSSRKPKRRSEALLSLTGGS